MSSSIKFGALAAGAVSTFVWQAAFAQSTILDAIDRGVYSNFGVKNVVQPLAYQVGDPINPLVEENRPYFIFDLSAVTHEIAAAELRLKNPSGGYSSSDATETIDFFDVSADLSDLSSGFGGVAAFDDLGAGTLYGEYVASSADDGTVVVVSLNTAAVTALNSSFDYFAFGGAIVTLDEVSTNQEFLFGFAFDNILADTQLVVMGARDALGSLTQKIISLNLSKGISSSFDAKLNAALGALDDMNENNDGAAINSLEALINAIEAQRGGKLTDSEADALIATAQAIIASLGG